jgi:hypothetical protein
MRTYRLWHVGFAGGHDLGPGLGVLQQPAQGHVHKLCRRPSRPPIRIRVFE